MYGAYNDVSFEIRVSRFRKNTVTPGTVILLASSVVTDFTYFILSAAFVQILAVSPPV